MTVPFDTFFALRSLSPSASEIHLVGGADLGADRGDAIVHELAAFVQSCLEVLGDGRVEVVRLGARGVRVVVDDAMLAVIERQSIPRLHDTLAATIRHRYPIDVVWRPR